MGKKRQIEIEGKKYDYNLNLNAMVNFEEETGTSIMNMKEGYEFGMKDVRGLLWAGINEEKETPIEEIGKLITLENIEEVSNQVMAAFEDVMPEGEENTEVKNKNRSAG